MQLDPIAAAAVLQTTPRTLSIPAVEAPHPIAATAAVEAPPPSVQATSLTINVSPANPDRTLSDKPKRLLGSSLAWGPEVDTDATSRKGREDSAAGDLSFFSDRLRRVSKSFTMVAHSVKEAALGDDETVQDRWELDGEVGKTSVKAGASFRGLSLSSSDSSTRLSGEFLVGVGL